MESSRPATPSGVQRHDRACVRVAWLARHEERPAHQQPTVVEGQRSDGRRRVALQWRGEGRIGAEARRQGRHARGGIATHELEVAADDECPPTRSRSTSRHGSSKARGASRRRHRSGAPRPSTDRPGNRRPSHRDIRASARQTPARRSGVTPSTGFARRRFHRRPRSGTAQGRARSNGRLRPRGRTARRAGARW